MICFLGNVLVGIKIVFLLDCPLVLPLLKHRGVTKKIRIPSKEIPLNNSIDKIKSSANWIVLEILTHITSNFHPTMSNFPHYHWAVLILSNLSPFLSSSPLFLYQEKQPFLHFGNKWLCARGRHTKTKSKNYLLKNFLSVHVI